MMRRFLITLSLLLVAAGNLAAQAPLEIRDVLPPYRLSAALLLNGHFSISTRYTGESKTLIYQEDGTGGRPVNYTSHLHLKVDDVIFQLPYELNPVTREAPPEHPLTITGLFRDTVAARPRVNARMYGVMPDGDTIRLLFTMHPVKRPSGGFIRMQAEVENSTSRPRSVGVLMLVDTKIGENDRAPIVSAFGYRTRETEYLAPLSPGMPEFWLALEGTPIAPGLTARGNLRASGLIEPDFVLVGNWKDNTAVAGATGLALARWRERRAVDADYTDSAVLLLWEEETMAPGEQRLRAATEIGIVDSLGVGRAGLPVGDIYIAGSGIGGSGCLGFEPQLERPCGDTAWSPYLPDSLQTLYLVTNGGPTTLAGVTVATGAMPRGLRRMGSPGVLIPGDLGPDQTGVATLALEPVARLFDTSYRIPLRVASDEGDLLWDTLCVALPGLLGELSADMEPMLPVCPAGEDTVVVTVRLEGSRCLPLVPRPVLIGSAQNLAQFSFIDPIPDIVPADGLVQIRLRYQGTVDGARHDVQLVVAATDSGLGYGDRDTAIVLTDTVDVTGVSRSGLLSFAEVGDTLDLGAICLGDTARGEWLATNLGGCMLMLTNGWRFEGDPDGAFGIAEPGALPASVDRGTDREVPFRFAPAREGEAVARFILASDAPPFLDTLVVRGRGVLPSLVASTPVGPDTVCPGEPFTLRLPIENPAPCDLEILGISGDNPLFELDTTGFLLPGSSRRQLLIRGAIATEGKESLGIRIRTAVGETLVPLEVTVASRQLSYERSIDFGDARIDGGSVTRVVSIRSTGNAPATIGGLALTGASPADYRLTLPPGRSLPMELAPGESVDLTVTFRPGDLDTRRATLSVTSPSGGICGSLEPIALEGRGVTPLIDVTKRRLHLGELCALVAVDTTLTVVNQGNAPLTVSGAVERTIAGEAEVEITRLPFTVPPGGSAELPVRLRPTLLGDFEVELTLVSDGAWRTAPDTTVRIGGRALLCGIVSADTMHAMVGDVVPVALSLDAAPLTPVEVADLLERSGVTGGSVALAYGAGRLLPRRLAPERGILGDGALVAGSNGLRVDRPGAGSLRSDSLLAVIDMEVLLSGVGRIPLLPSVDDFAGGLHRLVVRPGLLIAEYCAYDRRVVHAGSAFVAPRRHPSRPGDPLLLVTPRDEAVRVELVDGSGQLVALLHDGVTGAGTCDVLLPTGLASGLYGLVTTTAEGVTRGTIVVER